MVNFGNVLTAMVTPFDENLNVNYKMAADLAEHLVNNGSDGLVITGTTGESPTLTLEEKVELVKAVVKRVGDKAVIIAGTGCNSTMESIKVTRAVEDLGIHGIMLVTPYYNKPSQEGLYLHFKTIAESTKLPILLYNVPGRTSRNVEVATVKRLSEIENIVAIKEASGNLDQVTAIIRDCPEDFAVYSGDDSLTLPILSVGGKGIVSVVSHVVGNEMSTMVKSYFAGDVEKAAKIHRQLFGIFKAMFVTTNPVPIKAALNLLGWNVGGYRLPLTDPSQADMQEIKSALSKFGLM
jgi:4-hydroxy-tetrahydrodipicolinate synthase